jgi:epoxyqueuosine reductase
MSDPKAIAKEYALQVGFDLVRVTSAEEFAEDREVALQRLRAGLMDGLPWFHQARILRGTNPLALLPAARSIISLGLSYYLPEGEGPANGGPAGRVARYAWGRDYHAVMKKRMRAYVEGLRLRLGTEVAARWYVDDGPMLDRAAARRAGMGWFGKNTNILTPSHGSWVFLGQVVTDLDLEPDRRLKKTCGSCVRCIDACPTGAIVAPYTVDNTRCISYQTIENRGEIPLEMRPQMQDWVFGCDVCQEVCPVNRKARFSGGTSPHRGSVCHKFPSGGEEGPAGPPGEIPSLEGGDKRGFQTGRTETLDLLQLLEMSEDDFRRRFRGSPVFRAKRVGLQRNACVVLGNRGDAAAVPALRRALTKGEPLVRGHAAWALGRIGTAQARRALERAGLVETVGYSGRSLPPRRSFGPSPT